MVPGKTKIAKLKPKTFHFMKRTSASIYMLLLLETVIPFLGNKQHCHPVIAGVTRNLFRAIAIYNFHIFVFSCRTFMGQTLSGLPRATKKDIG